MYVQFTSCVYWDYKLLMNQWANLYWNRTLARVFSCKFAAYFQEHLFLRTPLGGCFCSLHLWNVKIWLKVSNFCSGWHIYVKRMGFYSISKTQLINNSILLCWSVFFFIDHQFFHQLQGILGSQLPLQFIFTCFLT